MIYRGRLHFKKRFLWIVLPTQLLNTIKTAFLHNQLIKATSYIDIIKKYQLTVAASKLCINKKSHAHNNATCEEISYSIMRAACLVKLVSINKRGGVQESASGMNKP